VQRIFREAIGVELPQVFQRMTYDEAMRRFGVDKPDLRFGLEHTDITELVKQHHGGGVKLLQDIVVGKPGTICKVMVLPAQFEMSNSEVDKLKDVGKGLGGEIGWSRVEAGGTWAKGFSKAISNELRTAINDASGAAAGDVIFFQFGKPSTVHTVLGGLRVYLRDKLNLVALDDNGRSRDWRVLWVTDFPLFEQTDDGAWVAAHHPFTSPQQGHEDKLLSDPGACKARAYDLVLNGNEVGGGSIRIHDAAVQAKVFSALGISDDDKQKKLGFLLEALKFGCPPHGGIALGLDRFAMLLCGGTSLRDVIAYPKTQKGTDLLTGAPTPVSEKQLTELFIASTAKAEA
jgi:aspartyl-tRNA synthetase